MAALTFLYWPWAATPDLVVEGVRRASGDWISIWQMRCAFPHLPKPTTDSNLTLGSWPSHCCSPSARLSFVPLTLLCTYDSVSSALPCFLRRRCLSPHGTSNTPPSSLHDNDCPLSLSVVPPADRRVRCEGSVSLQALPVAHHMSCHAGACECLSENID
jgi:hypothetical protein